VKQTTSQVRAAADYSEGVQRILKKSNQPNVSATWVPPGHFYSPIVDPDDPNVAKILQAFEHLDLPENSGIPLDRNRISAMIERLSRNYEQLPFKPQKQADQSYFYENPAFSYGDAIILGLMMLEVEPKRIIEVGSGYSSCAMIDINDQRLGGKVELTFVDPYPQTLLGRLPESSRYRSQVIAKPVQSVCFDLFSDLSANDILFIDSTHVAKMGSDVNFLIFNVFPVLKPGVLIHIHDVPYPFEYPPEWIAQENRSWNEAYLLRAFLQFNSAFEIIFYNHFAKRKCEAELWRFLPLFLKNGGASIWLRRTH
jgi:hypothetical protein